MLLNRHKPFIELSFKDGLICKKIYKNAHQLMGVFIYNILE